MKRQNIERRKKRWREKDTKKTIIYYEFASGDRQKLLKNFFDPITQQTKTRKVTLVATDATWYVCDMFV